MFEDGPEAALETGMDTHASAPGGAPQVKRHVASKGDGASVLRATESARYIASGKVWLEGEALRQLEAVAKQPECLCAVGMPDLHPGPGYPIGAAFAFPETVHPHLVGGDAGCGAVVVSLSKVKLGSQTERRLRSEFDVDPLADVDRNALGRDVWSEGPKGLLKHALPGVLHALAEEHSGYPSDWESSEVPGPCGAALATIGGGNHFAEVAKVGKVPDGEHASSLGIRAGQVALVCHSGSRGIGKEMAERWGKRALAGDEIQLYLRDLVGAVRFAQANRLLLAWRLLRALGVHRTSKISGFFDVVHNDVRRESLGTGEAWLHRKGCAPAYSGQSTVVLGSRGTPSWVMRGKGCEVGLQSVAHGAGRKMRRSEAREKLRSRYKKSQLGRSASGGVLIANDAKLFYEEHPDVYKDIEPVVSSLEEAGMASRVASLMPLYTVKV